MPAHNEHIGEIAAVCPQKRQCELGSYYPARTFVKPLSRQYATTLSASVESVVEKVLRLEKELQLEIVIKNENALVIFPVFGHVFCNFVLLTRNRLTFLTLRHSPI